MSEVCYPPEKSAVSRLIKKSKKIKRKFAVEKFENLLKSIIGDEEKYRLMIDPKNGSISHGPYSGNMYAVITSKQKRVHTDRHVSFYYLVKTRQLEITYYKGYATRSPSDGTIEKTQTTKLAGIPHMRIRKKVDQWFTKQVYTNFLVEVSFCTEFPLFYFREKIITDAIGAPFGNLVASNIIRKTIDPAITDHKKEVERFYKAYTSAQNMRENVIICTVRSLETEQFVDKAGDMLAAEIANKIYPYLKPAEKTPSEKKWELIWYYRKICYWFISRIWNSPMKKPREISF